MTIIPENRLTSFREGHEETFRYYYEMYYGLPVHVHVRIC